MADTLPIASELRDYERRILSEREERVRGCRAAVEANLEGTSAYIALAEAFIISGNYTEGIIASEMAIALNSDNSVAHTLLGICCLWSEDQQRGKAALEKALRLDNRNARAMSFLAPLLNENGQPQEAVKMYETAIEIEPENVKYYHGIGNLLFNLGYTVEAEEYYAQAITLEPDNAMGHFVSGKALIASGKYKEAIKEFRKNTELEPGDYEHWLMLAMEMKHDKNAYPEALTILKVLAEVHPEQFLIYYYMGFFHETLQDYSDAELAYEKARALQPSVSSYNNLARVKYVQGNYTSALADFNQALTLANDPNAGHIEICEHIAGIMTLREHPDEYIDAYADGYILALRTLIRLEPSSFRRHEELASSLDAANRVSEALEAYRELLVICQNNREYTDEIPEIEQIIRELEHINSLIEPECQRNLDS